MFNYWKIYKKNCLSLSDCKYEGVTLLNLPVEVSFELRYTIEWRLVDGIKFRPKRSGYGQV